MPWKLLDSESAGIESAAYALYHAWFNSQDVCPPPIPWGELVVEDQERFRDAALGSLVEVFEDLYDWSEDELKFNLLRDEER